MAEFKRRALPILFISILLFIGYVQAAEDECNSKCAKCVKIPKTEKEPEKLSCAICFEGDANKEGGCNENLEISHCQASRYVSSLDIPMCLACDKNFVLTPIQNNKMLCLSTDFPEKCEKASQDGEFNNLVCTRCNDGWARAADPAKGCSVPIPTDSDCLVGQQILDSKDIKCSKCKEGITLFKDKTAKGGYKCDKEKSIDGCVRAEKEGECGICDFKGGYYMNLPGKCLKRERSVDV